VLSNPIRCAAFAAALSLVGIVSADGTLNSVTVDKSGSGVSVHIKGKDLSQPTKTWTKNGNSLVLEFDGGLAGKQSLVQVHKGGLNSIYVQRRSGQNKVRVYLALDAHKTPSLTQTTDGWDVSFGGSANSAIAKTQPSVSANSVSASVPPLESASDVLARLHGQTVDQHGPATEAASPRVTLNFTNTEVVQILKALAMQTGVNIVTAPDVKGTLSVTLDDVSVKDALDMVTSVSGLRYAKIGNSYIVATPDKIDSASNFLNGNHAILMETRIVPIYSGSGKEIRASVMSSMTDAATFGDFQIFLPNENYKLEKKAETGGATGDKQSTNVTVEKAAGADGKVTASGAGTDQEQVSVKGMKEQYVMLIGPSDRIDAVETRIKDLDREISKAYGFDTSGDSRLIRETYMLRSDDVKANELVKAVSATQPNNFLNVDLYATPAEFQIQSVVIVGREGEVKKAEALLKDLDQSGYGSEVFVYDVQHSDPRSLREALIAQVKGLRVSIPPSSVGNTRVYQEGKTVADAQQKTSAAEGAQSSGGGAVTTDAAAKVGGEGTQGLVAPYSDMEKVAAPMKLILTGTTDELDEAKNYLARLDTAPKQVALELRVMEMTKEDAEKIGLDWNVVTGHAAVRSITLNHSIDNPSDTGTLHIGGRGWGADVTATLDAFANKENLIARPNLLALDGRESEIFVGDVIRYIKSIQSTQNGTTILTDEVPVGVRLAVMPRISNDSMVLDLRPEVSFLKGFTPIPDGGQLPQTSLRTAQTTVAIHDGDTIAIGGLIQDQDIFNVSKVPLLGDLPIIGRLFRSTTKDKLRKELVLFLTAKVVNDQPGNAADPRVSAQQHPAEILSPPKP
jgi:type II secretory pathway component GspD/PulD (secretin)